MWSFLIFLLIGEKKRKSEASELTSVFWCLTISISLWSKDYSPTRGGKEESLLLAGSKTVLDYLFCNSFLSNILFLSLVIKNWNASFSVDVLALTICLTLDKVFNLSKPVFLSVSTASDTTQMLSKYVWVNEMISQVLSAVMPCGFPGNWREYNSGFPPCGGHLCCPWACFIFIWGHLFSKAWFCHPPEHVQYHTRHIRFILEV